MTRVKFRFHTDSTVMYCFASTPNQVLSATASFYYCPAQLQLRLKWCYFLENGVSLLNWKVCLRSKELFVICIFTELGK